MQVQPDVVETERRLGMASGHVGFLAYFTRHKTIANLLMVLMIGAGLVSMTRIRAQYFPDVVVAEVVVSVAWSGAGAEDVDRGIVQVLEPALLTIEGVTDATSRAAEGSARITLEFEPGVDLTRAAEDVQAAVAAVRDLPEGAEVPVVRRGAWRDQVTDVVITGPVSIDQIGRFADELVGRLFAVGVTRTTVQGLSSGQTVVEVPSVALIRHDVTMAEIAAAIAAEARTAPAGEVGNGAARVRAGAEKRSGAAIAGIVLRSAPDGSTLTIGDLAVVRVEGADRGRAAYVGDNPAMIVRVDRSDEGDAIRMQAQVAEVAAQMQQSLPQGVTVALARSRSEQISDRLALLTDDALTGLALVVAMLFLTLNTRTAIWVAAGIPIATFSAIAVMYAAGLTINMISMFALIVVLGIVVDDAIVVAEHADFRMRKLGEDPMTAAENAARRMWEPVVGSTLVMVISFFGLVVIGGRFGGLIADIPFTVIAVLLASLVECFLILPNHLAHALASSARQSWYDAPSRMVNRIFDGVVHRFMRRLTALIIKLRYPVLALAVLALATQAALLIRGDVQFRFFNGPEQTSVVGNFSMLPGARREDSAEMMRELQRATEAVAVRYAAEHGMRPATFVMAEIGGGAGRGLAGADTKDADLLGGISIELIDQDLRPWSATTFIADLQAEVRNPPLLEELSFRGGRYGPGGDALSVDLYGADAVVLKAAAEAVKTALAAFPEATGLEDSLAYDKAELVLTLTPQGQALGFGIDDLGRSLRDRLNGIEAATYPDGPRTAAIRVELPKAELTADFLERTLLRTDAGAYVPLADIVTVSQRSGFSTIRRENGLRMVTVSGDLAEENPARAAEVQRVLAEEILPKVQADFGVVTRLSGLAEQQEEFFGDAWIGFGLALLGIYLVLAWVFSSWTRPLVVMSVIPFGVVGAVWGHYLWGVPLSLFSIVGMIGMSGIIINDSIVLVSTVDEYSEHRGLIPAIVDGVADRLRPVFLTTATTILGLVPLLYEDSSQAEFLLPTVIVLVYGLGFGMVLVLLVVPALLVAQADVGRQFVALRRMLWGGGPLVGLRTARGLVLGALAAVLGLFAATLGVGLFGGGVPGWILAVGGPDAGAGLAFGLLVAGAAFVSGLVYLVGRVLLRTTQ